MRTGLQNPAEGLMSETTPQRRFKSAPVVELALSVQFDRLDRLNTAHLGLLWQQFSSGFPTVEEHPALSPMRETFGGRTVFSPEFRIVSTPPSPRLWFLDARGSQLIQVQEDRFAHNWRKLDEDDVYPSYKQIRSTFQQELERFDGFLQSAGLGPCSPNLCEVTYVDHVAVGDRPRHHGDLGGLLTVFDKTLSLPELGEPEEAGCALRFVLRREGEFVGRLYFKTQPAFRKADQKPIFAMELTARGKPFGPGLGGAIDFLDYGHERLFDSFLGLTRPGMHQIWQGGI